MKPNSVKKTNANWITKISYIKKIASQEKQNNWEFRSMLKASGLPEESIDNTAHGLFENIKNSIDCTSCAHCCKVITPVLSEVDIRRIASYLNVSIRYVKKTWLTKHEQMGIIFNSKPCPFLKNKKCSIYPARPRDCKSYPHLHRKRILNYFTSIFSHIDLCPIVFHFYEGMKREFTKKLDPEKTTWL